MEYTNECRQEWVPYEEVFVKSLRGAVGIRWMLAYPLQRRFFGFSVGEYLLGLGCMVLIVLSLVSWDTANSGSLAQIPYIAAFAAAAKNSPLTYLAGVPFERRVEWHKLTATFAILHAIAHGAIGFISRDATKSSNYDQLWSGCVAGGAAIMLGLTSYYVIRRQFWEIFLMLHILFFLVLAVFLVIHSATTVLIGIGLWVADVLLRFAYTLVYNPTQCRIKRPIQGSNIIEVTLLQTDSRRFDTYAPGQWVFISFPGISMFGWHPISISSSPAEPDPKLHIRCGGDWGQRVLIYLQNHPEESEHSVLVDGPYGNCSINIGGDVYQDFLLVAGGVGITPMRSIAVTLADQKRRGRDVKTMEVHWSVRDGIDATLPQIPNVTVYKTGNIEDGVTTPKGYSLIPGRMNFGPIIQNFRRTVMANHNISKSDKHLPAGHIRVAVLFCGPAAMLPLLKTACKKHNSRVVQFDVHSEVFEF